MREKLEILMQEQGLSASRLAAKLGIKPAGLSHILNGRNKPNFELTCKIVNTFPEYNPYWLLGSSTDKYSNSPTETSPSAVDDGLNFREEERPSEKTADLFSTNKNAGPSDSVKFATSKERTVERVVVFYSDNTFDSYEPTR